MQKIDRIQGGVWVTFGSDGTNVAHSVRRAQLEEEPDLETGWERQLTTGKRAERTKHAFRCPICHSDIGQARPQCLICARRR